MIDNWKTHFGSPQLYPVICETRNGRYFPVYFLQSCEREPEAALTSATTTSATLRKAVDAARSRFAAHWERFEHDMPPVKPCNGGVGDVDGCVVALGGGEALQFIAPLADDSDASILYDRVDQLVIEKMNGAHLAGSVLLEYELFGADNSFIADFASNPPGVCDCLFFAFFFKKKVLY